LALAEKNISPNGKIERNTFDGFGRVIKKEVSGANGGMIKISENIYDDFYSPKKVTQKNYFTQGSLENINYFDGFGQNIYSASEIKKGEFLVFKNIYDNSKRLLSTSQKEIGLKEFDINFEPEYKTNFEYDLRDKILKKISSTGIEENKYDLLENIFINKNGISKKSVFDIRGNLIKIIEDFSGENIETLYNYNKSGNLTKITDSGNNIRNFEYDSLGRQILAELPHKKGSEAAIYKYQYDALGNKIIEELPSGKKISYKYDSLNRILEKKSNNSKIIDAKYFYDTGENSKGLLSKIETPNLITDFIYNILGSIISETKTFLNFEKKEVAENDNSGEGVKEVEEEQVESSSEKGAGNSLGEEVVEAENEEVAENSEDGEIISFLKKIFLPQKAYGEEVNEDQVAGEELSENSEEINEDLSLANPQTEVQEITQDNPEENSENSESVENEEVEEVWDLANTEEQLKPASENIETENQEEAMEVTEDLPSVNSLEEISEEKSEESSGVIEEEKKETEKIEQVEEKSNDFSSGIFQTKYIYDDYGKIQKIIYPNESEIKYFYNETGKLNKVQKDNSEIISNIEYNSLGQKEKTEYSNGISEILTYDKSKEFLLENKIVKKESTNSILENIFYLYDNIGNILSIKNTGNINEKIEFYNYDNLNRLTEN
jgi:YD repeat-containing protein